MRKPDKGRKDLNASFDLGDTDVRRCLLGPKRYPDSSCGKKDALSCSI